MSDNIKNFNQFINENQIMDIEEKKRKPNDFWTFDRCKDEASKYNSRVEFQKGNGGAYLKAQRNGWLDEISSHMKRPLSTKIIWTFESCKKEALNYKKRTEFKKCNGSAYGIASKNRWLNDICSHMIEIQKSKDYWIFDKCKEEALNYNSRFEFQKNNISAYKKAWKEGWLDEICSHMTPTTSLKKRYIYAYEFPKTNSVYVGLTWNLNHRHLSHMNDEKSSVYKYMKIHNLKNVDFIFKEFGYYDMLIAGSKESEIENQYHENGWVILNKAKTGALGGSILKWTFDKCKKEALNYKTRTEFYKNNLGAYLRAQRNGWLDDICQHMIEGKLPNGYWNFEKCREEALNYKTRSEFSKYSNGAYDKARDNNWLDDICQHMKIIKRKWTFEECKEEASKYNRRSDLEKGNLGAYKKARKEGWIDYFFLKK